MPLRNIGLLLLGLLAVPGFAPAANTINSVALGEAQGVLDFCTSIDRGDDRAYDRQNRDLYKGMGEEAVERIRHSAEFRQGYAVIQSILREVPAASALQSCKQLIAAG